MKRMVDANGQNSMKRMVDTMRTELNEMNGPHEGTERKKTSPRWLVPRGIVP
jgi:hypothetical protein